MTEHDPLAPGADDTLPAPSWQQRALRLLRGAAELVVVGLAALLVVGWLRAPSLPVEAPDFALVDLEGRTVTLSELRGRPVVLSFWATWCGVCRAEMPSKVAFTTSHPEVVVLGVAVDRRAAVLRYASDRALPFRNVIASQEVVDAYGIDLFPTTVVLDAAGRVVWTHSGAMLWPLLELATWWAGPADPAGARGS